MYVAAYTVLLLSLHRNCPSLHINVMPVWPQDQQNDEEVDVCSFALFFLRILLLLGGDVERNPGPESKYRLKLTLYCHKETGHFTIYYIPHLCIP